MQTFKMFETPIGNLSAQTFRPTEAEKVVLLNIDDMIAQGRHVTQQDAINVPQEKLDDEELNKAQLESAYKQLIQVRLIQVEPDQTVVISSEGQPVVEELKKAEAQKADQEQEPQPNEQPQDQGMGGDVNMGPGAMPGAELGGMQGGAGPMEGIDLIRYLNDMSKLLN